MAYVVLMLDDGTVICGDSGSHEVADIVKHAGDSQTLLVLTNGWIIDDGFGGDPMRCIKPLRIQMSRVLSVELMRRIDGVS